MNSTALPARYPVPQGRAPQTLEPGSNLVNLDDHSETVG